jgi:hypothetical protein
MSREFLEYVNHPRYGQGPRITGLNPQGDNAGGSVTLHWHSPEGVRIPDTAIPAGLTRQTRATIPVTHYFDAKRQCVDCGRWFIFFAAEQKFWYEELGFPLESDCIRCAVCRKKQRGLEEKRQRYEELFHVRDRTVVQEREMAECSLSLIEEGLFGERQLERVRYILKRLPPGPERESMWTRVQTLERGG